MASKDYYQVLGVSKTASSDEIKSAFRKLAHQHHPDKGGDAAKFKEINEAYGVLSDTAKRQQYDTYGSSFEQYGGAGGFGSQGFGGFNYSDFARAAQQGGASFEFDLGDIFGEFFGGGGGRRPRKGRNISVDIEITFKDSIFGTNRDISIGKEKISVTIPSGIESGEGLRVPGKGEQGEAGPGDLIVRIWVQEHPRFKKHASSLVTTAQVKLSTALAGGDITLETLEGELTVTIPSMTKHGDVLRVKGKGVPMTGHGANKRGDLLITVLYDLPKKLSKSAQKLVQSLKEEGL
jgi:DnaJ-class molecular chaperone